MKPYDVVLDVLKKKGEDKDQPDKDFDLEQLKMGTKIEKEHTDSVDAAKEIAKDHLREHPKYYTYLQRMEKKIKD